MYGSLLISVLFVVLPLRGAKLCSLFGGAAHKSRHVVMSAGDCDTGRLDTQRTGMHSYIKLSIKGRPIEQIGGDHPVLLFNRCTPSLVPQTKTLVNKTFWGI